MQGTLVQQPTFVARWKRLGLADDDLQELEAELLADPTRWPVMAGTGGARKMRFAPPSWHTGKSGATRVAYAYVEIAGTVYLLDIYGKNDKANLTKAERNALQQEVAKLFASHAGG